MPVFKVIEVLAQSPKGWEEAARVALEEASRTVENIQSICIEEFHAIVEDNRIARYRINAKISFVVHSK